MCILILHRKDLEPFSMFILMDKEVSLIPSSVGRFSSLMALFAAQLKGEKFCFEIETVGGQFEPQKG